MPSLSDNLHFKTELVFQDFTHDASLKEDILYLAEIFINSSVLYFHFRPSYSKWMLNAYCILRMSRECCDDVDMSLLLVPCSSHLVTVAHVYYFHKHMLELE